MLLYNRGIETISAQAGTAACAPPTFLGRCAWGGLKAGRLHKPGEKERESESERHETIKPSEPGLLQGTGFQRQRGLAFFQAVGSAKGRGPPFLGMTGAPGAGTKLQACPSPLSE